MDSGNGPELQPRGVRPILAIVLRDGAIHVCNAPSPAAPASQGIGKTVDAAIAPD
jgi:hypothetical protein